MTIDNRLGELLDAATTDVPARHLPAPLTSIHARARRRRRTTFVVVAAAVAAALTGGFSLGQRMVGQAAPEIPAATASPPADDARTLPWVSAMVARSGNTITAYAGPGAMKCKQLWQPQATITEQDDNQVVIAVTGRIVDAADCSTSWMAVPLNVSLQKPLGDRALRDAATGLPHPTYFERDLPDLRSDTRWSPHPSHWSATDESWHQGYNGPNGSGLYLTAQGTATRTDRPATVATTMLGSRQGTITDRARGPWTVWWEVGDVTYSLGLIPNEGDAFTLEQFKQELARLKWS